MCVADAQGAVACWQGVGPSVDSEYMVPGPLEVLLAGEIRDMRAIAAGGPNCGLRADGRVVCWPPLYGLFLEGEGGTGMRMDAGRPVLNVEGAVAIASGAEHACAQDGAGRIWCWGSNLAGQLGSTAVISRSDVPLPVGLDGSLAVATDSATCSLDGKGRLFCWGNTRHSPQQVPLPSAGVGLSVEFVGDICTMLPGSGLDCVASVDLFHPDWSGLTHIMIPNSAQASLFDVSLGWGRFVGDGGQLWCWHEDEKIPRRVEGIRRITNLAVESDKGCAVAETRVYCWQWPYPYDAPVKVSALGPGVQTAREIKLEGGYGCLLRREGRVSCWGDNSWGQLGDGSTVSRETPVDVPGLTNVLEVSLTWPRACALRTDGAVYCWGGTLGQGSTPSLLVQMPGATALAVDFAHVCVVAQGQLYCVGDNTYGQLAHNPGWTPVRVEGLEP